LERGPAQVDLPAHGLHKDVDEVLLTAEQIQRRIAELGQEISLDYSSRSPILVGVLKGVIPFISDLMRQITVDVEIDLLAVHRPNGYGHPDMEITRDVQLDITGRHVIVVEDIVDMGQTLDKILEHLRLKNSASLEVCALLDKPSRRLVEVPVKYVGFEIPNRFVVGYGLDYEERLRNLPYIGTMKTEPEV
jgi:hypoxanthine phosphoribosyltransferase